jgi:hypothetical protein
VFIETTIEDVKQRVEALGQQVGSLQKEFENHSGQLKVLSDFVNRALAERADLRVDEAVERALERKALRKPRRRRKSPRKDST